MHILKSTQYFLFTEKILLPLITQRYFFPNEIDLKTNFALILEKKYLINFELQTSYLTKATLLNTKLAT